MYVVFSFDRTCASSAGFELKIMADSSYVACTGNYCDGWNVVPITNELYFFQIERSVIPADTLNLLSLQFSYTVGGTQKTDNYEISLYYELMPDV